MSRFFGVAELARKLGVRPRAISDAFYAGRLSEDQCPVVSGRRLIPKNYVPTVRRVVKESANRECRELEMAEA